MFHAWLKTGRQEGGKKGKRKKLYRVVVHRIDFRIVHKYMQLSFWRIRFLLQTFLLDFVVSYFASISFWWEVNPLSFSRSFFTHGRHVHVYLAYITDFDLLLWMMVVVMMMTMNVILYTCLDLARRRYIFMMRPCSLEWSPAYSVCVCVWYIKYENCFAGMYICKRSQSAGNNHAWKYDIFRIDEYLLKEKKGQTKRTEGGREGSTIFRVDITRLSSSWLYVQVWIMVIWWEEWGLLCILHYVAFTLLLLLHWALPEWALIFQVGWSFAASVFFG